VSPDAFLEQARDRGAHDLYLAADTVPFVRVEGAIERLSDEPLSAADAESIAVRLLPPEKADDFRDGKLHDGDVCLEHERLGRFRLNVHRTARGAGVSLKCIPTELPTLASLGLPDTLEELTWYRTGMVLVTGPAGCGKSSTLAALVHAINVERREHIVTIEDPIEYVFVPDRCNVTQREVGTHTRGFSTALRAALREDPDVILVSELRDRETIRTAVVAAETGHLVLGTLHTRDAASTVSRLLDVFPADEQEQVRTMVAASLRTVVSQRLLPRLGGGRRVPAYEILHATPAVAKLVRDGRLHQLGSQLQIGRKHGMVDLDTRLAEMVEQGLVDAATARRHSKSPGRLPDA